MAKAAILFLLLLYVFQAKFFVMNIKIATFANETIFYEDMTTTLTIDEGIYRRAERYALQHHKQSVRNMVESYFLTFLPTDDIESDENKLQLSEHEKEALAQLPSSLRSLYGCAAELDGYRDPDDDRYNYLMEKYK